MKSVNRIIHLSHYMDERRDILMNEKLKNHIIYNVRHRSAVKNMIGWHINHAVSNKIDNM